MARAAAKKTVPASRKTPARRKKPAPGKGAQSVTRTGFWADIVALRLGLRKQFEAMLSREPSEERLLGIVALVTIIAFLAGLPDAVRIARDMPQDDALLGLVAGRFVATVIFGSLFLYGLAGISHWVAHWAFRGNGTYYGARLALFWALALLIPLVVVNEGLKYALHAAGFQQILPVLGVALFLCWLWIWSSFIAIAEGFARAGVFLFALAICACLVGMGWLLNAAV